MKTRYKKQKIKKAPEEIINDKWLKIHITSHKIVKSEDEEEIKNLRKNNQQILKSINRLKNLL